MTAMRSAITRRAGIGRRWSMRALVIACTFAAALGSGAAFAYFTAVGSGSGSAVVGSPSNVTISTNAAAAGLLQPGGTGDLVISASNPNPFSVQITAITLGTVTGCTTPAVTLTSPSSGYLPFTIPANALHQRLVITGALTMGAAASNDCQGAALTVPITPTVQR